MIYRGICSCGADCIGKTIRNSEIRWNEHITGKDKNSDYVQPLKDHFDHELRWFVLSCASKTVQNVRYWRHVNLHLTIR